MRALHSLDAYKIQRFARVAWAVAWAQGPTDFILGNYNTPTLFKITKIEVIKNEKLNRSYNLQKSMMRILNKMPVLESLNTRAKKTIGEESFPMLDDEVNECVLFSGFSRDTLNKIIANGFRPDLGVYDKGFFGYGGKGHGALGRGAYFSDRISKAIAYTPCPICEMTATCTPGCTQPERKLLVSRVLLGKFLECTDGRQFRHNHHNDMVNVFGSKIKEGTDTGAGDGGYNSIIGKATKAQGKGALTALWNNCYFDSDEYLIRNPSQAYPEFIISYVVS